jgi:hypothetical protein
MSNAVTLLIEKCFGFAVVYLMVDLLPSIFVMWQKFREMFISAQHFTIAGLELI